MKDTFEVIALSSLNALSDAYCILNEISWHFSRRVNLRKVRIFLKCKSLCCFPSLAGSLVWIVLTVFKGYCKIIESLFTCAGECGHSVALTTEDEANTAQCYWKRIRLLHQGLNDISKQFFVNPFFNYSVPQLHRYPETFFCKVGIIIVLIYRVDIRVKISLKNMFGYVWEGRNTFRE